eukprot:m51a1_g786 putative domain containing protein (416) ;mRNA; r:625356-627153
MGAGPSKDPQGRLLKDTQSAVDRRHKIACELLSTEQSYVESLVTVQQVFLVPLGEGAKSPPLPQQTVRAIFSIWENIAGFHQVLLPLIQKRVENWGPSSSVGDIFLQNSDFMRMYAQYANGYIAAITALDGAKKQAKFAAFLEETYKNSRLKGLELGSFLIMPIQRIPRYVMLLQDLVKHTPASHADYDKLCSALSKVQEIAVSINEKKRDAESQAKILEIDELVGGKPESLVKPYRYYVFEGALTEIGPDGTAKPAYVYLFSDIMLVTRPTTTLTMLRGKYTMKMALPLDRLQVQIGSKINHLECKSPAMKMQKDEICAPPVACLSPAPKGKDAKGKEKEPPHPEPSKKEKRRKSIIIPEMQFVLEAQTKEEAFKWLEVIQEAQVVIRAKNSAWEKALEAKGGALQKNACCVIA